MTLIAFLIGIFILVLVHEFGHFIVARWCGVRVETFSICFGPKLFSWKRGDTTYQISAIPLGGYVKLAGDQPGEEAATAKDGYLAQPVAKRAAIIIAGPVMNLIFAFVVAPFVYLVGVPEPTYWQEPATIGWVAQTETTVDLHPGDQIIQIGDEKITNWQMLQTTLGIKAGEFRVMVKNAAGEITTVTLIQKQPGELLAQLVPPMSAVVKNVVADGAAAKAGMKPGDKITALNGIPVRHWMQIRSILDQTQSQPITAAVDRQQEQVTITITPQYDPDQKQYLLGVSREDSMETKRYRFGQAIVLGAERVTTLIGLTLQVLYDLFGGNLGLKALGGPIAIAQSAGDAARAGLGAFLIFMVFISIQLGILNLLPIPILDGGHLVLLVVEKILGRRPSDRWVGIAQWIGMVLLIGLMLYVTRNDIMRIWGDSIGRLLGH